MSKTKDKKFDNFDKSIIVMIDDNGVFKLSDGDIFSLERGLTCARVKHNQFGNLSITEFREKTVYWFSDNIWNSTDKINITLYTYNHNSIYVMYFIKMCTEYDIELTVKYFDTKHKNWGEIKL